MTDDGPGDGEPTGDETSDGTDAGDGIDEIEPGDATGHETDASDDRPPGAEDSEFHEWLGLEVTDRGDGTATVTVPYGDRITNPFGVPHGGIVATAIDVAAGGALSAALGHEAYLATTDLDVSYLESAAGDLTARAEVVRAGGTIGVVRVDVESVDPEGESVTVAIGTTTYRVFREGD